MVLGKIKDIIKKHQEQNEERRSKHLGFKTVSDYHSFKQKAIHDARKKANTINRKKLRDKIQKKVIYKKTHSPFEQFADTINDTKKKFDQFQDSMDGFDQSSRPRKISKSRGQKTYIVQSKPRKKRSKKQDDGMFGFDSGFDGGYTNLGKKGKRKKNNGYSFGF